MIYKAALVLNCLWLSFACTIPRVEVPAENNSAGLLDYPVTNDKTDKQKVVSGNRRLKSFFVDMSAKHLEDHQYELEYARSGAVQQLIVPDVSNSDAAPHPVFAFFYQSGELAQIIRKEKQVNYHIIDGKTTSKNWFDRTGKQHSTSYEYDVDGNLTRVVGGYLDLFDYCQQESDTYSGAGNLTLGYAGNQIVSIVSDTGDVSAVYEYDSNQNLIARTTSFSCGGDINETFTYNESGKLATHELKDNFNSTDNSHGMDSLLDTFSEYQYNDKDQIVSITRSRQRDKRGRVRELNFKYDANDELVEIRNSYDGVTNEIYTLAYENGVCKEQTYSDPEYIVSPTHNTLFVNIYPESLRCGYFLPSLDDG